MIGIERTYKTVSELKAAIDSGELDVNTVGAYMCKYELFINNQQGKTLFSSYYGTANGCYDVCELLGLPEPEHV